jgi:exosortase
MSMKLVGGDFAVVGWCAVWLPAMISASYSWQHGEYYDYGWIVPPAGLWLLTRRCHEQSVIEANTGKSWFFGILLVLPFFLLMRVFFYVDPVWRLPVGLLGVAGALVSHWIFARARGLVFSLSLWKITLLMLSAIPWSYALEKQLIALLTENVIECSAEIFRLCGKPVEVVGDRMSLHGMVVEVTQGCSGVRSFQSFLMATWFFAELQRLQLENTLKLLAWGLCAAFVVNTGRASVLALIRFRQGEEAAAAAHDSAGLVAFCLSAAFFYWLSLRLERCSTRRVVRKKA